MFKLERHTVRAPVFGTLNSAISNFQTWFVRTVMEVLKYCWMWETSNMQCNYNSFIQIINFHGLFRNALRCRNTGACRILVPLRYMLKKITWKLPILIRVAKHTVWSNTKVRNCIFCWPFIWRTFHHFSLIVPYAYDVIISWRPPLGVNRITRKCSCQKCASRRSQARTKQWPVPPTWRHDGVNA